MSHPSTAPTTPQEFVNLWKGRGLTERSSSQTHFAQLCHVLGVAAPFEQRDEADYCFDAITAAAGSHTYARSKSRKSRAAAADQHHPLFDGLKSDPQPRAAEYPEGQPPAALSTPAEPRATRITSAPKGSRGFADVWKRGCFCWEYKRQGRDADLNAALDQLKQYRDSLDNPPLLIVCDVDHYEIHTNFTGYPTVTYRFTAEELITPSREFFDNHKASPLHLLRAAFDAASAVATFRPKRTLNAITEAFAKRVADLATAITQTPGGPKTLEGDPVSRHEVAHFLMQIVFCLFAEDVGLLPADRVTSLIRKGNSEPRGSEVFTRKVRALFKAMEKGGDFGEDTIDWFNGGLFKDVDHQKIPALSGGQLGLFVTGQDQDWSAIEPSILGTLFERALDTDKRAQIGAHYTSRDDIMLIVGPVIMDPLRKEWALTQTRVNAFITARDTAKGPPSAKAAQKEVDRELSAFHDRLAKVTVLDPACGSGNFLYVAIQCLLDLEKEVIDFAGLPEVRVKLTPRVNPTQLHGIEINEYAAELARISIWIGFLKWKKERAAYEKTRPILHPLDTIENRDAILDRSSPNSPAAAKWPKAEFVVGNPPFLGTKMLRANLGDDYVEALFDVYEHRIPGFSDLVCYWFELARSQVERYPETRVGLLATQAIRNGEARTVLERIKQTGDIFMAWSDRLWTLDGAAVRVSMVGFDRGAQTSRSLDGQIVQTINADLTTGVDLTDVATLKENNDLGFVGDVKGGPFDVSLSEAVRLLASPGPNGRRVAEVVRPYTNGLDVIRRDRAMWVVDFGESMPEADAAAYGDAFQHVEDLVRPARKGGRPTRDEWWLHMRPCPSMRRAVENLPRYLATATLTKHRTFVWMSGRTLPDHQLIVFGRSDDYFFGALHSVPHELWSLRRGTQLEDRPRYTPTSTFETFPLPWAPGREPMKPDAPLHQLWKSISTAAEELNTIRERWLNPPELIAKAEQLVAIKYKHELAAVPADVRPLVRRSAVMAEAASNKSIGLTQRTLTNLYNERPAWLRLAHLKLDRAVLAAYKAVDPRGDWDPAWADAYEPFGAGEITIKEKGKGADKPEVIAAKRAAIAAREITDAKILANLLRLNHQRAGLTKPAKTSKAVKPKPKAPSPTKAIPATKRKKQSEK